MALLILACSLYIFLIIGENLLKVFFILLFFTDLKDISLMRKVVTTCVGGKLLSGNQTVMEGTSFPLYCQTLGLVLRLRFDFVLPLSQEEQEEQEQEEQEQE